MAENKIFRKYYEHYEGHWTGILISFYPHNLFYAYPYNDSSIIEIENRAINQRFHIFLRDKYEYNYTFI